MKVANEIKMKLKVEDVSLSFGGLQALMDVNLEVKEGEIFAIIGPNGAGKTCLLNCINGFYRPQSGHIYFEGREISSLQTYKVAQLGIARVFQGTQLYSGLSVLDNLMAARHIYMKRSILSEAIYFGRATMRKSNTDEGWRKS